jgi:FKBP-type peptidyl-prolyl cis-trans isomerase FkpA
MKVMIWTLIASIAGILLASAFFPTLLASNRGDTLAQEAAMSELVKEDLEVGAGAEVTPGQTAVVHYTGWLHDPTKPEGKGKKFDSSRDHGDTFDFIVGGERRLIIPAELGYGARGAGGVIPGGATLVFDVELTAIR